MLGRWCQDSFYSHRWCLAARLTNRGVGDGRWPENNPVRAAAIDGLLSTLGTVLQACMSSHNNLGLLMHLCQGWRWWSCSGCCENRTTFSVMGSFITFWLVFRILVKVCQSKKNKKKTNNFILSISDPHEVIYLTYLVFVIMLLLRLSFRFPV